MFLQSRIAEVEIMPASIQIHGLKRIMKKVKTLQELRAVKTALKAAALHVKGKVNVYPPASEANRPRKGGWYERGYGPKWYGGKGGKKTSQTLGRKWTTAERDGGLTQVIGNNVTYGPFVQDKDRQAWFHKKRGWKTIQDVAKEETKTVLEFVENELEKVLNAKSSTD
jgi:hypothetical protein